MARPVAVAAAGAQPWIRRPGARVPLGKSIFCAPLLSSEVYKTHLRGCGRACREWRHHVKQATPGTGCRNRHNPQVPPPLIADEGDASPS